MLKEPEHTRGPVFQVNQHGRPIVWHRSPDVVPGFQTYLKEILNEVCNYNLKNPHRNMYELKPEYRHYKEDED